MTRKAYIGGTTALTTLFLSQAALADVTPSQVWNDMSDYMRSYGYAISSTETQSGGSLVVSDLDMSMNLPDDEGTVSVTMGELTFSDNGNGTVNISFPSPNPIRFDVKLKDDEDVSGTVNYIHDGLNMVVSGDDGAVKYTFEAASLGMSLAELTVDGDTVGPEVVRVDIGMNDVSGQSEILTGDMREISQLMNAGEITYDMAFNDPDGDGTGLLNGTMAGVSMDSTSVLPLSFDTADMPAALAAGFHVDGGFKTSGGASAFAFTEDGGTTSGNTRSDSAYIDFAFNSDQILYEIGGTGTSFDLSGPEIPLPISAAMEETAFVLDFPLGQSDVPAPFEMGVTLGGFTMSDLLWNIFDPGKVLARDPATIMLDTVGTARMLADLMDEESMMKMAMSDEVPAELHSLTLRGLLVEAAGTRLEGTGAFTFDNNDLETFGGLPHPNGAVDLKLSGANGLIDNLISMGILAEQDAMGARMMMSMFTVPGEGQDNLSSRLEINDQGHIMANGQRIK